MLTYCYFVSTITPLTFSNLTPKETLNKLQAMRLSYTIDFLV